MKILDGKRALVTGGSRGIGAGIAKALAAEGASVVITYERSEEKAQQVVREIEEAGGKAIAIAADSADPAAVKNSVEQTVAALGGLDILVNNAGIGRSGMIADIKLEDLDAMLNVNIRGVVLTSQAAIPHLGQGGRIVNIGSCLGERVGWGGVTVYSMTKAALNIFSRGLSRELGPMGITVNTVQPGPTDTDMNPADGPAADGMRKVMSLGHYGTVEDIAAAVVFLAGPSGRQITGTAITVDGGLNA
ncbi:SDR family oxidoreductase [Luteolibacter pohnpeiensis]|uniref:SDR family oxidoreductase n=1 Tax=Luteolibacter pohnpeiensis TaxID=454153 RepID=A0A934SAS7_9BACT|nr:SDR family oxidoreductase [Luteolibacter pohnpeiensis]MBK1882777.1 SDR family oxidoreductase [Luteolibacter pohnpeiensis]